MAYPESIPIVRGRHSKEFLKRLESFKLTSSQLELYRDARRNYRRKALKE